MSNALITGASRGIGAATARLFAREGWNVAVNYNRSRNEAEGLARELSGLGVRAFPSRGTSLSPRERSGWSRRRKRLWAGWMPLSAMRGWLCLSS